MPDFYTTIDQNSEAEFKDRGSRFLAFAFPVKTPQDFKNQLVLIKKNHPKASHYCFAYRIGTDGNTFRAGDDGEPAGTAGKPILGQIDSRGLTDVCVVVVRYFGGSLLGVPGLIHAYKTACGFALQTVPAVRKDVLVEFLLQFDYTIINDVMQVLKQHKAEIKKQEAQLFYQVEAGVPAALVASFTHQIANLRNVTQQIILSK